MSDVEQGTVEVVGDDDHGAVGGCLNCLGLVAAGDFGEVADEQVIVRAASILSSEGQGEEGPVVVSKP